jgi:pyridoxal phosphate enzyme (YggS family)
MPIAANLQNVRDEIDAACKRASRRPDEVVLIGITKGVGVEKVIEACQAGLTDLGENRVREALEKMAALDSAGLRPRWHFVGHIQTNKARDAAKHFAILHSVDSVRLAKSLSARTTRPLPVLLEVNVAREASKFGFRSEEVASALRTIATLPNLLVQGLMTVPPRGDSAEDGRPYFRLLRELRDALGLRELSMGMTDDFPVAVEEGATMVRVGRAIFGPRNA